MVGQSRAERSTGEHRAREEGRELTEKGEDTKRRLFEYSFKQNGDSLSLTITLLIMP